MTSIVQDIRHAARRLTNAPGFTAVAVTTLALGIGATVAVFSIVYGVLLKPLPYGDPSRLMLVTSAQRGHPSYMSPPDLLDYRSLNHTLSGLAGIGDQTANLTRSGAAPLRLSLGRVSANFFDVLGVRAALGRTFAADADRQGAPKAIVLAYATWRDDFAADTALIGKTITLDGAPWTVIGVAPSWLNYPRNSQGWVPLQLRAWEASPSSRGSHEFRGVGRLKDGVTAVQADQDLRDVAARLAAQYPETNAGFSAGAWPLQDQMVQGSRKALLMLLGAVAFVLLVACVNVANLLLARAASREGEMAVRTALGAGRWDLVRQLLAESVLLAAIGTAAGALLAQWLVGAVVDLRPGAAAAARRGRRGRPGAAVRGAAGRAHGGPVRTGAGATLGAAGPGRRAARERPRRERAALDAAYPQRPGGRRDRAGGGPAGGRGAVPAQLRADGRRGPRVHVAARGGGQAVAARHHVPEGPPGRRVRRPAARGAARAARRDGRRARASAARWPTRFPTPRSRCVASQPARRRPGASPISGPSRPRTSACSASRCSQGAHSPTPTAPTRRR